MHANKKKTKREKKTNREKREEQHASIIKINHTQSNASKHTTLLRGENKNMCRQFEIVNIIFEKELDINKISHSKSII